MPATRALLVIGHGREDSLCHHLVREARRELRRLGARVRVHDLLADGFDPVLRLAPGERWPTRATGAPDPLLARYQRDVRWAEVYVVVHPVWWFAPPAILKGWVDRVLIHGVALDQPPAGPPRGILTGHRALVVQTLGVPRDIDRGAFDDLAFRFWSTIVFPSVNVRSVARLAVHLVDRLDERTLRARTGQLHRAVERLLGP